MGAGAATVCTRLLLVVVRDVLGLVVGGLDVVELVLDEEVVDVGGLEVVELVLDEEVVEVGGLEVVELVFEVAELMGSVVSGGLPETVATQ